MKRGGDWGESFTSPVAAMPSSASNHSKRRSFTRPSWLLCTVADLDEKMKKVILNVPEKSNVDSFAQRVDAYYQKRPQLLALLQELYKAMSLCLIGTAYHYPRTSNIVTGNLLLFHNRI